MAPLLERRGERKGSLKSRAVNPYLIYCPLPKTWAINPFRLLRSQRKIHLPLSKGRSPCCHHCVPIMATGLSLFPCAFERLLLVPEKGLCPSDYYSHFKQREKSHKWLYDVLKTNLEASTLFKKILRFQK